MDNREYKLGYRGLYKGCKRSFANDPYVGSTIPAPTQTQTQAQTVERDNDDGGDVPR
jgi:hypothetical protein